MTKRRPGTDNRVLRVCRLLNGHRVRYVLAGGVAANLHGVVRSTRDVDVLVPKDARVPYLAVDELIRSKATGRLQDRADIEALKALSRPAPRGASRRTSRPRAPRASG